MKALQLAVLMFVSILKIQAQISFETIAKEKGQELKDKAREKARQKAQQALEKQQKEFDESNFNYLICFLDNSGSFEADEKGNRLTSSIQNLSDLIEDKEKSTEDKAYTNLKNGEMLLASNKFFLAEKSLRLAKKLYEEDGKKTSLNYSQVLSDLGMLYEMQGRLNKAQPFHEEALALRKSMSNEGMIAVSQNNIAVMQKEKGNFVEAEATMKAVLVKAMERKDRLTQALIHNNLAMTYLDMNKIRDAENQMHSCLSEASTVLKTNTANYIKLQINLANIYRLQKKYINAEQIYTNAIAVKEKKLGNHPDLAHLKKGLAQLYLEMDKSKEAEELLLSASEIYKRKLGENNPATVSANQELGNYYRFTGNISKSLELLEKVAQNKKNIYGSSHPQYTQAMFDLAQTQWQAKKIIEAAISFDQMMSNTISYIREFFGSLNENEKTLYWDRTQIKVSQYLSFWDEREGADSSSKKFINLLIATKGFLLNGSSKARHQILQSGDAALISSYKQWLECKELLNEAYQLSHEQLKEEGINADSLSERCDALERELSQRNSTFKESQTERAITYLDIQKSLLPDEAVVEIVQIRNSNREDHYVSYVIKPATLKRVYLGKATEINEAIAVFREKVINRQDENFAYAKVWKPLSESLKGAKNLYISADGAYHQLSIQGLKDEDGRYLGDKVGLQLLCNSADVIEVKKNNLRGQRPASAVLIGNPKYGQGDMIEQLPGTELEVKKIAKLLLMQKVKATSLIGESATEQKIKELHSPTILHFATHGYFLEDVSEVSSPKVLGVDLEIAKANPLLRSGLLLANCENVFDENFKPSPESGNGVLTAFEAMNLELDKTDLVVLSACQTGLGTVKQGEGVYGLQRAFLVAGAKSIIMSLWNVSDDATMHLMSLFYSNFMKNGNRSQAFTEAIRQVKTKYKEPYYWAAFVMLSR
jgi:CHAT domain-containing protein